MIINHKINFTSQTETLFSDLVTVNISKVETFITKKIICENSHTSIKPFLFLKLTTDHGIDGWGEAFISDESEKIVVESKAFREFLVQYDYELVTPVIDANGGGNLLPQNIEDFIARLTNNDVDRVFILTDLEDEPSVDEVKQRVAHAKVDATFVAVKALEAWFLADSNAMKQWLKCDEFNEPEPEQTINKPWERLKEIAEENDERGPGSSKVAFAKRMVKHWGFDVQNAANHPACLSAEELVSYFSS